MVKRGAPRRKMTQGGLKDKRYRKTEEAIIEVLLRSKQMPSTGELTRRARISRSTLYRHHRAIPGIVPDYEKEIINKYGRTVRKMLKRKGADLKSIYLQMLIFVVNNRRVFGILFKYSGDRVVERMVLKLQDKIAEANYLPKKSEKMMRIYTKEVAGIVEGWYEKEFNEKEMNKVLEDIIYLTRTMKRRLRGLNE